MKHSEFNIAEMHSNSSNGKTSAGKVYGGLIIISGLISYMIALFNLTGPELSVISYSSTGLVALGSSLVIGKILSPTKEKSNTEAEQ